jgi:homoserine O-succinyltransferase
MSAHDEGDALVIGLVNNMPDGALKTTERQFRELLTFARGDTPIRLRIFSLPEAVRAEATRAYITDNYEKFGNLWTARLDGLIVTGTEPRTPVLTDEPYWQFADEARRLGAGEHHLDVSGPASPHMAPYTTWTASSGRSFPEKLSGVFECARAGVHRMLADAADTWRIPHSRSNDLPAKALTAAGYQILSTSPVAGADMFIKQTRQPVYVPAGSSGIRSGFAAARISSRRRQISERVNARPTRRCRAAILMPAPPRR